MLANLQNSAVATRLEKVTFHSNPKEGQCQRMIKLPHNCTHLTYQQRNAQYSPSKASQYISHELPDIHDDVITNLEPDILLCEVKWALESITRNKASGGDGIPVELFQILRDDAVKVLHSICQQIWKTQQVATGLEKVHFHSNPKERQCQRMIKLPHNCTHLTCQ